MYFCAFNFRISQAVQKYFNYEIFTIYGIIKAYFKIILYRQRSLGTNTKISSAFWASLNQSVLRAFSTLGIESTRLATTVQVNHRIFHYFIGTHDLCPGIIFESWLIQYLWCVA